MAWANGIDHDVPADFVWDEEYRRRIEELADTDQYLPPYDSWPTLLIALKYLVARNIETLDNPTPAAHPTPVHTSAVVPGSSAPLIPNPFTTGRTISFVSAQQQTPSTNADADADAEPREQPDDGAVVAPVVPVNPADAQGFYPYRRPGGHRLPGMSEDEVKESKARIFELMDQHQSAPPFTLQRVCELALISHVPPERRHYRTLAKYLRALERSLLVTAPHHAFPLAPGEGDDFGAEGARAAMDSSVPRHAVDPMDVDTVDFGTVRPAPNSNATSNSSGSTNGSTSFPFVPDGLPMASGSHGSFSETSMVTTSISPSARATPPSRSPSPAPRHFEPLFHPIPWVKQDDDEEEAKEREEARSTSLPSTSTSASTHTLGERSQVVDAEAGTSEAAQTASPLDSTAPAAPSPVAGTGGLVGDLDKGEGLGRAHETATASTSATADGGALGLVGAEKEEGSGV